MKLYICFLLSVSLHTSIFAQALVEEQPTQTITHETFLNKPFTLEFDDEEINDSQIGDSQIADLIIADADDQIPPHALSEEDITTILFNEYDLGYDDAQEDSADTSIIIKNEESQSISQSEPALQTSELQEKKITEVKNPEELFLNLMQKFILEKNIISKETLYSSKMAKSQGKLIAEYLKEMSLTYKISIAQARNITQDYIQKKCQDLNLGISNVEKKSLKKLLQTI